MGKSVMVIEVPGREGEEVRSESGWITSGTTCRRKITARGRNTMPD